MDDDGAREAQSPAVREILGRLTEMRDVLRGLTEEERARKITREERKTIRGRRSR